MPWTKADVDKHKKGLSDRQKERWAKIANDALRTCLNKGGSQSSCEASAIRQANGVVGNKEFVKIGESQGYDEFVVVDENIELFYMTYKKKQIGGYVPQHRTFEGREYLVVPVTMMVEGVHHGSHGPLLHTIDELGRFPASWNGMAIVIDHPSIEGRDVSANEPDILEARMVGRVFNTRVENSGLKAEAWLDIDKLRQLSAPTLAQVEAGEPIEVSLGVFSEELVATGEWNGEQYEAIARNHRPDHLALLPGGRGACSIADGCGIRANNEKGGIMPKENDDNTGTINQDKKAVTYEDALKTMKVLNGVGFTTSEIAALADSGYRELVDAVRQKLDAMDSETAVHYLAEVYDNSVVYEVRYRIGGVKLYKQGYTFEGGVVELQGSPVEVRRKTEFIAVAKSSGLTRTKFSNNSLKEDKTMPTENGDNCTPCIKKKVDALIAHASKRYAEDDREWLESLSETQLDKLVPIVEEKEKIVNQGTPLTDAQKAALAFGERQLKLRREKMVKTIQDNAGKETWPDEVLAKYDDDTLERIFKSLAKEETKSNDFELNDFTLSGGQPIEVNAEEEEPMAPTGVVFKKK